VGVSILAPFPGEGQWHGCDGSLWERPQRRGRSSLRAGWLGTPDALDLEQWDEPPAAVVPTPPRPATAFASYDAVPPADDDTQELRLRIDETRDRIRRRAQEQDAAEETDQTS